MPTGRDASNTATRPSTIRVLAERDLPLVTEHFLRLDADSRRDRFGAVSDADIRAYVGRLPVGRGVLAGIFPDDSLRGVIEARPVHGQSCHWESVVSVEAEWRRRGLATALTNAALASARKGGASRLYMRCSIANSAAQHFLARLTPKLREDVGETIATLDLSTPAAHVLRVVDRDACPRL